MPYFKWQGVDLQGKDRKGTMFARSSEHLDSLLLKRDIALMSVRTTKPLISLPINLQQKINFFRRLSTLLDAGVHLPQALSVLSESIEHPQLQEIISCAEQHIQTGQSLHEALAHNPSVFNPVMIHMINVGQEAGALPLSLKILTMHLETKQRFYKKIRAAALLPALTFLFFISIALVIFIVVMPLFSGIFESMQQEVPAITKKLMQVSAFLGSSRAVLYGVGLVVVSWLSYLIMGKDLRKKLIDRLALRAPGISHLVIMSSSFSFFQSIAMLLEGGMQLVPALRIGNEAVGNHILRAQLDEIARSVASGSSLSQALTQHVGPFSRTDIEAMIMVGQESGQLASMLSKTAQDYKERTERLLSLYSSLFQPIMMIILGAFIALLIVAVYLPILSLSYVIS